jgi:hypothetical protein
MTLPQPFQHQGSKRALAPLILRYLTGHGGAGVTASEATAQMFAPDDSDRPMKAFL